MKRALKFIALLLVVAIGYHLWFVHLNYRFETISEGKVYKSAAIPPQKIADYLSDNHIRTVIDLRHPGLRDKLNPANQAEIDAEAQAIARIDGVRHINIPSPQVPTRETLQRFLTELDDPNAYPVLIHCYHGTGRAAIYSALYRIEYEGWANARARAATRPVVQFAGYRSSFADGKSKGDFLMNYRSRDEGAQSTLSTLGK